jgi:hypothetical protein
MIASFFMCFGEIAGMYSTPLTHCCKSRIAQPRAWFCRFLNTLHKFRDNSAHDSTELGFRDIAQWPKLTLLFCQYFIAISVSSFRAEISFKSLSRF